MRLQNKSRLVLKRNKKLTKEFKKKIPNLMRKN